MAGPHFDEMRDENGAVRAHFRSLAAWLADTPAERVAEKRREADLLFHRVGITFAVYGDENDEGAERLIPFDTIPRVIPQGEWSELARGLEQRVTALNRFLHDIYHGQEILKAGVIPAEQVLTNAAYEVSMVGLELPNHVYSHIAGVDLVRHDGKFYVLEDNLRTPSGVSYMLENRKMMMRLFPELFATRSIRPVQHYPDLLLENLHAAAPAGQERPTVAVLTPVWLACALLGAPVASAGAALLVRDHAVQVGDGLADAEAFAAELAAGPTERRVALVRTLAAVDRAVALAPALADRFAPLRDRAAAALARGDR